MTVAPTVVRYEPRGAALELFHNRTSEIALAGAAGTGKSLACLFRIHLTALQNPHSMFLICRKTAASLGSTTLVSFEKKVIAQALAAGLVSWFGGSPREAPGYRYKNGAKINVGGLDKPEKIMSSEYDIVFVDEATEITLTDWESIGTRLRSGILSWQQQIAACNPVHPTHWLKLRANEGKLTMLTSLHRDNPAYVNRDGSYTPAGRDYIEGKLGALTGVRRLRLLKGLWAAAEGLVYGEWEPDVHLVDPGVVRPEWTRWWTVDFGFTNPFVLQCWAEDPDGRLYLYREIYKTKTLVEDHAKHILRLVRKCVAHCGDKSREHDCHACKACRLEWTEPKPRAVVCDHDAEDRATLEKHLGMGTSPAKKSVSDGIQAFEARLRPAGDGRPRLYVVRDALVERDPALEEAKKPMGLADEITGYVWDVRDGKQPKEQPVKENDHSCDAARYMVAERDLGGRPRIRTLG